MSDESGQAAVTPPRPTEEDFASVDWRAVATTPPTDDLHELTHRFRQRARDASAEEDLRTWAVFEALADICSLVLRTEASASEPFVSWMVTETFRTASLGDLTPETVQSCRKIYAQAEPPELRARLADIVWTRVRDHQAAHAAVQAYMEIARAVQVEEGWPDLLPPLTRSLQIAVALGPSRDELLAIRTFMEEMLEGRASTESGFLSAKLLELLLEYGGGDTARFSQIASEIAERALSEGAFHRAQAYWELAARWAEAGKDRKEAAEARRQMLGRVADAYVAEAEDALKRPHIGHTTAAGILQKAIEVLRRAGKSRKRVDALLARLVEIQEKAVDELFPQSHSFDATEFAERARISVAGKSITEALGALAREPLISRVEDLRATAERHAQEFAFMSLMPKVILGRDGKVVARQGSVRSRDPEEREAALRAEMLGNASMHQDISARVVIDTMRRQIISEHGLAVSDFLPVLQYNPFVPAGREMLYAEGLIAGFYGDMAKAAHLLIPQLEESIRVLLHQRQVQISTLDQYGIQKELNLNNLLYIPLLKQLLGDDLVFALQGLLVEKFGSDLRNRMAHGQMSYGQFYGGHVLYLWWLCLRFCLLPVVRTDLPGDGSEGEAEREETDVPNEAPTDSTNNPPHMTEPNE
jgi:hypothetical protein